MASRPSATDYLMAMYGVTELSEARKHSDASMRRWARSQRNKEERAAYVEARHEQMARDYISLTVAEIADAIKYNDLARGVDTALYAIRLLSGVPSEINNALSRDHFMLSEVRRSLADHTSRTGQPNPFDTDDWSIADSRVNEYELDRLNKRTGREHAHLLSTPLKTPPRLSPDPWDDQWEAKHTSKHTAQHVTAPIDDEAGVEAYTQELLDYTN